MRFYQVTQIDVASSVVYFVVNADMTHLMKLKLQNETENLFPYLLQLTNRKLQTTHDKMMLDCM